MIMNSQERRVRISELQKELSKLKEIQIIEDIQHGLGSVFNDEDILADLAKFNLPVPSYVSVEYYGEYDDEGGTELRPEYIYFYDENKKCINELYEEASWEEEVDVRDYSRGWNDVVYKKELRTYNVYDYVLRDAVYDIIYDGDEITEYVGWDYIFKVGN